MFQLRGLGAIPMSAYGAGGGPVVVESTSIDVPYLQPPVTYPVMPSGGGGGTPPYTPNAIFQLPTQPAMTYNPIGPTVNPPVPGPLPPPPSVMPPIPTNPTNPDMPAPGGTQVTMNPPPSWLGPARGKVGWIVGGLALLALVGGVAAYNANH